MTDRALHLLEEIRNLPRCEQLKLVENVIHDLAAGDVRDGRSVVGLFADEPQLVEEACDGAMAARERDPLRRPGV